jgi:ankyrin repeat protein
MGNKDYEVRNKDYSSNEYHYNGSGSYGYNEYSRGNGSYFFGIFVFLAFVAGIGTYVAFNYEALSEFFETNLKTAKPSRSSKTSSRFGNNSYNNKSDKIKITQIRKEDLKNRTPSEIQEEEQRKKSYEAARKRIFGNSLDSKNLSQVQNQGAIPTSNVDNKPVSTGPEVLKPNDGSLARNNRPWKQDIDKNSEEYAEIRKFENEFFRRSGNLYSMDEAELLNEIAQCQKFYEKYDSFLKDKPFTFLSRKSSILASFVRIALNKDYTSLFQKTIDWGFVPKNWTFDYLPIAFYAIEKGSVNCLDIILKSGIDLKKELQYDEFDRKRGLQFKIEEGKTLLHAAAEKGYFSLAKQVLEAGVPVDKKTKEGKTPLYYAIKNNQYEMVQYLTEKGAELSSDLKQYATDDRILALFSKSETGNNSEVSDKPETSDKSVPTVEETKPKTNVDEEVIFNYIKNGELINIFMLSEKGKDISNFYYNNEPAVCIAVRFERFEILKYLVHEFDCKKMVNTANKRNALHYAVIYYNRNIVQFLIDNGFPVNEKDSEGNTPLHYAVSNLLKDCAGVLLRNKADPNALNNNKQNALHLAIKNDNAELVALLLKNGANVNQQDNDGNTPLHYCSMFSFDNKALMKELYKYEDIIDLSIKNNNGKTPRDVAQSDCFDYYEKNYKGKSEDKFEENIQNEEKSGDKKQSKIHLEKYMVLDEESCIRNAREDFSLNSDYVFCPAGPIFIPYQPAYVRLFLAQIAIEKDYGDFLDKLSGNKFHPVNEPEKYIPITTKVILSMIIYAAEKDSRKCVEVLIKNGADLKVEAPKPKDKQKIIMEEGKNLIHCAAQHGNIYLLEKAIEAGAEIEKKTLSGKTPLYFAVKNNQYEAANILISKGAVREESLKSETSDEKMLKLLETGK